MPTRSRTSVSDAQSPLPDGVGEHAAQARRQAASPLLVAVDDRLGVAAVGEAVAARLEDGPQLGAWL